jgi:hypothetical protein
MGRRRAMKREPKRYWFEERARQRAKAVKAAALASGGAVCVPGVWRLMRQRRKGVEEVDVISATYLREAGLRPTGKECQDDWTIV